MITEQEKSIIQNIARKYHASKVLLFGSSLDDTVNSNDIDIAVEGVNDGDFYSFYGELIFALEKPVDVIDLSLKSKFIDQVIKEGMPLEA
jgi:predicted nucleotidyltransferase